MFSPSDCFSKSPDLVLRRFPEWRQCYAYTPAHPDLFELNAAAWLIVELCKGQPLAELERDFLDVVGRKTGTEGGRSHLYRGLEDLVARGILVRQTAGSAMAQG